MSERDVDKYYIVADSFVTRGLTKEEVPVCLDDLMRNNYKEIRIFYGRKVEISEFVSTRVRYD